VAQAGASMPEDLGLSAEEMRDLREERARREYKELEERMLRERPAGWAPADLEALQG
jgi:hypothetical protein